MMITYDSEADAIYVYLTDEGPAAKAVRVALLDDDARMVDYNEAGDVIGVELLGVTGGFDLAGLPEQDRIQAGLSKLAAVLGTHAAA